jgi:tRNA-binding EMAP/Myf-like protein
MTKDAFITVFANLKEKKTGSIMSQGMVMCASPLSDDQFELVRPPPGSKLGERIKLEGNLIPDYSEER